MAWGSPLVNSSQNRYEAFLSHGSLSGYQFNVTMEDFTVSPHSDANAETAFEDFIEALTTAGFSLSTGMKYQPVPYEAP